MAPRGRGRPRKRGNTRMDAALDAMSSLGFPNKCVRQTVKDLLKVYGGDDGWIFIEEAAYRLLIDMILDKQHNASPERIAYQDDSRSIRDTETSIVRPSCGVIEPICSENEVANPELHTAADMVLDCSLHSYKALDFQLQSNEARAKDDKIPATGEEERGSLKDVQVDLDSGKKNVDNVAESQTGKQLCVKDSETDRDPADTSIQPPKPAGLFAPRKRKPYHGWICDDSEEDLMCLTPEPLPETLKKFLTTNKKAHSEVGCEA